MQRSSSRCFLFLVPAVLLAAACGGTENPEAATTAAVPGSASLELFEVPVASLACSQEPGLACTASVTGGVPPYTYFWSHQTYVYQTKRVYSSSAHEGGLTRGFGCLMPEDFGNPWMDMNARLYVKDATGAQSATVSSGWYTCG